MSQYTFGFGQPSGGSQVNLYGSPSLTDTEIGEASLNEFNSAFRTNTELEVALPHSL